LLFFSSQKPGAGMVGECIGIAYVARQNVNALVPADRTAFARCCFRP
jgi:hypothetical protein